MNRKQKLDKLKDDFGGCCAVCGEKRYWVLEFHHTNPREHSGRPGWTTVRSWTYDKIYNEYSRETVLLCRNCHGDAHYQMNNQLDFAEDDFHYSDD